MISFPSKLLRDILNRLRSAAPQQPDAGKLHGAKVKLFKSNLQINRDTTLLELDNAQADFPGYQASNAIVWGQALTDDDGQTRLIGDTKQFTATGGDPANTIWGYYIVSGDETELIAAEKFTTPVNVTHAGDGLAIVPVFGMGRIL